MSRVLLPEGRSIAEPHLWDNLPGFEQWWQHVGVRKSDSEIGLGRIFHGNKGLVLGEKKKNQTAAPDQLQQFANWDQAPQTLFWANVSKVQMGF